MKPEEKIEQAYEELRAIIDGGSESFTHEDAVQYLKDVLAQQSQLCRSDGRCQYAIDCGAEGMGHCPKGKCVMPVKQELGDPLHESEDVSIGVDVTEDGTSVVAMRKYRNGANVVFYSQFHPLVKRKGEA